MLKEIRERHIKDNDADMRLQPWTKQIHQDRAYLLGLVEEAKDILEDIIFYCDDPSGWEEKNRAKDFLKKLESEGRE
jgi:hypothetical protein